VIRNCITSELHPQQDQKLCKQHEDKAAETAQAFKVYVEEVRHSLA
jgi:hypothetical protein